MAVPLYAGNTGLGDKGSVVPAERHTVILDLLAHQEIAGLAEIQAAIGASEATARRDLAELAQRRLILRTRGGARRLQHDSSLDEEFSRRRRRHSHAKRLIAALAADRIEDGASVFLNDGSTTFALAQELDRRNSHAFVATCALNVAELLAHNAAFEVVVIGGTLRRSSFGTIGPLATHAIEQIHTDLAFLACDGLTPEGVRSNSLSDAEVGRQMARHADRVIVVADSSKFATAARAQMVGWEVVDELVTDTVPPDFPESVANQGVQLALVGHAKVAEVPPA